MLTSITGSVFRSIIVLPSHVVGAISLVFLAVGDVARYAVNHAGAWRWIYVVSAILAQWLNVFVLVAQSFHEGVGAQGAGADAIGAAVPDRAEPW